MNRDQRLQLLLARRAEFAGFLASRLGGNHADAEDLLQHGLARALAADDTLRDDTRLVPWFYQLLRNAAADHVRARRASAAREERWAADAAALAPDPEESRRLLCACLEPLLRTLPPAQADLVRRCELGEEPLRSVAAALGLTPNVASAALHRARASLRAKLQTFCGDCARGACLDCDCEP